MIYAQRPDATACASYDLWNKRIGRFVHQHSQGIALIDATGDQPRLKYVFDIADTGGREQSRRPLLWEMRSEHEGVVSDALEREYGATGKDGLADQIHAVAMQLADLYWQDREMQGILHEDMQKSYSSFCRAIYISSRYCLNLILFLLLCRVHHLHTHRQSIGCITAV